MLCNGVEFCQSSIQLNTSLEWSENLLDHLKPKKSLWTTLFETNTKTPNNRRTEWLGLHVCRQGQQGQPLASVEFFDSSLCFEVCDEKFNNVTFLSHKKWQNIPTKKTFYNIDKDMKLQYICILTSTKWVVVDAV